MKIEELIRIWLAERERPAKSDWLAELGRELKEAMGPAEIEEFVGKPTKPPEPTVSNELSDAWSLYQRLRTLLHEKRVLTHETALYVAWLGAACEKLSLGPWASGPERGRETQRKRKFDKERDARALVLSVWSEPLHKSNKSRWNICEIAVNRPGYDMNLSVRGLHKATKGLKRPK